MSQAVLKIPEKGERWKCPLCPKSYQAVSNLRHHLLHIHNVIRTPLER